MRVEYLKNYLAEVEKKVNKTPNNALSQSKSSKQNYLFFGLKNIDYYSNIKLTEVYYDKSYFNINCNIV